MLRPRNNKTSAILSPLDYKTDSLLRPQHQESCFKRQRILIPPLSLKDVVFNIQIQFPWDFKRMVCFKVLCNSNYCN